MRKILVYVMVFIPLTLSSGYKIFGREYSGLAATFKSSLNLAVGNQEFMYGIAATNYYLSPGGNDQNSGTSPDQAWKSINKLKSIIPALQPGDIIYFERGGIWNESEIEISKISGTASDPIVFKAYGSGKDPVITGGKDLSGGFTQSGKTWTHSGINYRKTGYIMNNSGLLINNQFNRVAVHPNDSYFTTNSTGKTSLSDPSQNWTNSDITGGQVAVRAVNWAWSVGKITSSTSTSLNFTELLFEMKKKPTYYYLQNVPVGLDKNGEWVFDNTKLSVYYEGNLNAQKVEFPVVDTVLNLKSVKNILFSGIEFRGANGILINLQNGMNIHFEKCTFRMAGTGLDIDDSYNSNFTDNYFEYIHTNGIIAKKIGNFNINDNSFRHIHTMRGMNNDYDDWSSCIAMENNVGEVNVRYNTFDTVMIAFQTHWSEANWYFERNLIKDYAYILGDVGGVYCGGDWRKDITKSIKENIFLNAHANMETASGNHIGSYGHGVYWDYDSNGIKVDGNTFVNANGAIYSNRNNNNTAVNNKFINCAKDLKELWGMDIFMDNLIDGSDDIAFHSFSDNTFVFGNNQNERAFGYHYSSTSGPNWGSIKIQNNTYQSPFHNNLIHREINSYSENGNYSVSDMCSRRNFDCGSTYNPLNHFYKDVSGTGLSPEEFTKVVYNASKERDTVLLNHTYIDLKGVKYSGVIYLEPYETRILFYHSGTIVKDTEKPSAPTGLKADETGESEVKISWNPSSDDFGVSGYNIYVNGTKNSVTTKTNHVVKNLSEDTKYSFYVIAHDAALNYSDPSESLEVTTKKNEEPQDTTVNEEPQDTTVITEPSDTTVIEDTASQVIPEPEELPEVSIVNVVNSEEETQTVAKVSFFGRAEIEQFGVLLSKDEDFLGEVKEYAALPEEIRVNNNDRVMEGLQLLYNFSEGQGSLVRDLSGSGKAVDVFTSKTSDYKWLPGQGLRILSNSLISSSVPPTSLIDSLISTHELTMEVWIKPAALNQSGPARIISLSKDHFNRAFTLGQTGTENSYNYVVRLRTSATEANGTPEDVTIENFPETDLHHVVFTHNAQGTEKIFINGKEAYSGTRAGDFSTWDRSHRLALANELTGDRSWLGTFYLVAIYNRALGIEEVNQNYETGCGQVEFTTKFGDLEPDNTYFISPYVKTEKGTKNGEAVNILTPSNLLKQTGEYLNAKAYPNPSNGSFTLFFEHNLSDVKEGWISISDVYGKMILYRKLEEGDIHFSQEEQFQMDTHSLVDGIYVLTLSIGKTIAVQKLMIQR